jgi:TRAP transporter 4TM/12TM fusion protein
VAWTISGYGVAASLFHLYTAVFGVLEPLAMRSLHLLFLLPLAFLIFPASKRSPLDRPTGSDLAWAAGTFVGSAYIYLNAAPLTARWVGVAPVEPAQVLLGTFMIIAVVEASRRAISPWFAATTLVFLAYLFGSPYLPGFLWFKGYSYPRIVEMMYLSNQDGIYGFLTGISANILFVFVLFAALMMQTGLARYFMDLSMRLAGRYTAGPAKVAVLSSALYGSISGSSLADAYATGSVTVPLMTQMGYPPVTAGAIEAVSSSGGSLVPPVMGAGAFVMASITGIPFLEITAAALLPAILFYLGEMATVHFEGARLGIRGLPERLLPTWRNVAKRAYLLLPFAAVVLFLVRGYAPSKAAVYGIAVSLAVALVAPGERLTLRKLWDALYAGAASACGIAVALVSAGIVVSTLTSTGVAMSFGSIILNASSGMSLIALLLVMAVVSVLGTGIPTTPSYIITVTIAAPALAQFGFAVLPVHMFVYYYAVLADILPPVAVTAFVTASLAGGDPYKTGLAAPRFALAGLVVPFIFAYQPVLLTHASWGRALFLALAVALCLIAAAAALSGYFLSPLPLPRRFLMIGVALAAILLTAEGNWIGAAAVALVFAGEWTLLRRKAAATANAAGLADAGS